MSRPASTYYCWSATGDLLYVGVTYDVRRRFYSHREKAWWGEVANVTTAQFDSRAEAEHEEARALAEYAPRFNHQDEFPAGAVVRALRLPLRDFERIKAAAASEHRTFSQEMRRLIERRLDEAERAA